MHAVCVHMDVACKCLPIFFVSVFVLALTVFASDYAVE